MKYFEFGTENPELMVMLHGGGTSYFGMLPTTKEMAKVYHVVLVAYDGFNPDEPETEFVSPMDEAKRLGDYIAAHYGGKIDILYGISYGCRVLMEVLADKRLTITTTIADGMGLRDYPNIRSSVDKKLSAGLEALKKTGYPFETKIFTDLGHGGLAGEHPEEFLQEVQAVRLHSLER